MIGRCGSALIVLSPQSEGLVSDEIRSYTAPHTDIDKDMELSQGMGVSPHHPSHDHDLVFFNLW